MLLLLAIFIINSCLAQNSKPLKNFSYYTNGSNKRIAEIRLTEDSLFTIDKTPYGDLKEGKYQIVGQQKKGKYFLIYIKHDRLLWIPPTGGSHFTKKELPPQFGTLVFYFSKDKDKLFVLQENKLCASVEEAKKDIQFEDKYFYTWYSDQLFKTYLQYPDIQTADKATVQKVIGTWMDKLKENSEKIKSTSSSTGNWKESLIKILIDNHLNPLATLTDLDKKITEYHIKIPSARSIYGNPPMIPKLDTTHSKSIKIHSPVGTYSPERVKIDEPIPTVQKDTTICDSVYSTRFFSGSQMTHLELGGDYPNAKYIIMIGGRSRNKFKEAPETAYKNKRICVTGKVISTKVIMISDPSQITLK